MAKKLTQFRKWFKNKYGILPEECRQDPEIYKDIHQTQMRLEALKHELQSNERIRHLWITALEVKGGAENRFRVWTRLS